MTNLRKRIKISFVIWLTCWLYVPFVLVPFGKNLPYAVNLIWVLLLAISSWVFFLNAATSKGYSHIIGIGLMMLNVLEAAILALLPDKSMELDTVTSAVKQQKGSIRKLMTAYIFIWVFFWFYVDGVEVAQPSPYYPLILLTAFTGSSIAAAIVWVIRWPTVLSGNPFPPMREGYRRLCLLVLAVTSLAWCALVAVATSLFTSINAKGVFVFFAVPIMLLLAITVITRVVNWVRAGFRDNG